ncbi:MAG: M23 family metallopeptidase [Treponema sp.]|nr:M23 family metallopeptidase [Treponema sp.]
MKKYIKTITAVFAAFCVFLFSAAAATQSSFEGSNCAINLTYNESAAPGDAIIIRMTLKSREHRKVTQDTIAMAELLKKKKKIDSSLFFFINPKAKRQNTQELLAYVPLSSWLGNDEYALKIIYTAFGSDPEEFILPFTLSEKQFSEEIVELDGQNTEIKTDTTPAHVAQIEKLNTILETVEPSDVYSTKSFISPVNSTRRTSDFGSRRTYKYVSGKTSSTIHYGIDFGVPEGTVVSACGDGRIVMAENRISTGLSVVIEHAPGLYSLYYHLHSLNVKEGQFVKQGDKLGLSGSTGLATGPHLHWELRLNMCAVSPDFFMTDYAYTKQSVN